MNNHENFFFVLVLNILSSYGYVQIGLQCPIHAIIHLFMGFAAYVDRSQRDIFSHLPEDKLCSL